MKSYLDSKTIADNDAVFIRLGLDKYVFAEDMYGYPSYDGGRPASKECDYAALTRLVKGLIKKTDKKYIDITLSINGITKPI